MGIGKDMYLRRVVDAELDTLFTELPAIAIEGAKGVGKTETAARRSKTVHDLDRPGELDLVTADPYRILSGEPPILIDEWQRFPQSWDLVRRAVDSDRAPSRFLLAGSATPRDQGRHSGAGRIVRVRMRPLTLAERSGGNYSVSFSKLISGERGPVEGTTSFSLQDYAREVCISGFPGLRGLSLRAGRAQLDGYIDQIIDHDFPDMAQPVRFPDTLRRWMAAYAAATSTSASFETIRAAATPGEASKPAKPTTQVYRDILTRLWIVDPVPAWLPTRNHLHRLASAPKHHLVDPALAARLLGIDPDGLLEANPVPGVVVRDGALLGQLFESLVTLDVRVYAQNTEASLYHFRTHRGEREIDLIVERGDHRIVAIEVKLKHTINDNDVRHLHWLSDQIGSDLLDAVVVTTGPYAYRRNDGIAVVPASLLGP